MPFSRSRSLESITRSVDVLVVAEGARLPEHGVDQGRFAVVDVGHDGHVADVVARDEHAKEASWSARDAPGSPIAGGPSARDPPTGRRGRAAEIGLTPRARGAAPGRRALSPRRLLCRTGPRPGRWRRGTSAPTLAALCLSRLTAEFICCIAGGRQLGADRVQRRWKSRPLGLEHLLADDRRDVLEAEDELRVGQQDGTCRRPAGRRW